METMLSAHKNSSSMQLLVSDKVAEGTFYCYAAYLTVDVRGIKLIKSHSEYSSS